MKTRYFYLNVDEDKVPFSKIRIEEDTLIPEEPLLTSMLEVLSQSPTVVDVSHLNYMPRIGDLWDGENFVGAEGISTGLQPRIEEENCSFSFTINDIHSFYCIYPGNEDSSMIIAALKSNPVITFEDWDA